MNSLINKINNLSLITEDITLSLYHDINQIYDVISYNNGIPYWKYQIKLHDILRYFCCKEELLYCINQLNNKDSEYRKYLHQTISNITNNEKTINLLTEQFLTSYIEMLEYEINECEKI